MRRIAMVLMLMISMLVATGCGMTKEGPALTDENGNLRELKLSEISDAGFYIYDKNKEVFTPIMTGGTGDKNGANSILSLIPDTDDGDEHYIWAGSKNIDMFKLIPSMDDKNRRLVMFQTKQSEMPDSYVLRKYKYLGYTIGVEFTFGDSGQTIYLNGDKTCSSSMAADVLAPYSDELLQLYKLNGSEDLPINNIDTNINTLLGLEKNKKYKLEFFDGTLYAEQDFVADTAVFKSQGATVLNNPLEPTENSFFYVKMPPNMKNGYYIINDIGMFRYKGQENPNQGVIEDENGET